MVEINQTQAATTTATAASSSSGGDAEDGGGEKEEAKDETTAAAAGGGGGEESNAKAEPSGEAPSSKAETEDTTTSSMRTEVPRSTEDKEEHKTSTEEAPANSSAKETKEAAQPAVREDKAQHEHEHAEQQPVSSSTQVTGKRQRDSALSAEDSERSPQKAKVDPEFDSFATTSSYSLEDLYDAERPEVPSSGKEPTKNLFINNLQRPFTSVHLRELLEKAGKLDETMEGKGLWLQKFKKYAFASFVSENDAEAVRKALYGVRWPSHSQKRMEIEFTDHTAEDAVNNGDPLEREPQVETTSRTVEIQPSSEDNLAMRETEAGKHGEPTGEDASKSVAKNTGTLDSLFMSTEAKPKLYYLPLDEEAANEQRKRRQDMHDKGVLTPTTPEGAAAMGNRPPRGRGRGGGRPFRGGRGDSFRGRPFRGRGGPPPPRRDSYSGRSRYDDRDRRDDRDRYGGRDRRDDRDDRRGRT